LPLPDDKLLESNPSMPAPIFLTPAQHNHRANTSLGASALSRLLFALCALLLLWITIFWALE
jgi:hypothetical protein